MTTTVWHRARRRIGVGGIVGRLLGILLVGLVLAYWAIFGGMSGASPSEPPLIPGALFLGAVLLSMAVARRTTTVDANDEEMDAITGLYRERYAEQVVPRLMARDDRRGESEIALVVVSVDELDVLIGRYGVSVIDAVLTLLGGQIQSQVRASDIAVRCPKRRLGIYLHCGEIEHAVAFGRRIAMLLATQQLEWRGDEIKLTVSMGVAVRECGEALDHLNARAESRRQSAEDAGGGQILA
jgi:diguanylate cyclase (GGDEF)-like protein